LEKGGRSCTARPLLSGVMRRRERKHCEEDKCWRKKWDGEGCQDWDEGTILEGDHDVQCNSTPLPSVG
jgi:hypothetical protein